MAGPFPVRQVVGYAIPVGHPSGRHAGIEIWTVDIPSGAESLGVKHVYLAVDFFYPPEWVALEDN